MIVINKTATREASTYNNRHCPYLLKILRIYILARNFHQKYISKKKNEILWPWLADHEGLKGKRRTHQTDKIRWVTPWDINDEGVSIELKMMRVSKNINKIAEIPYLFIHKPTQLASSKVFNPLIFSHTRTLPIIQRHRDQAMIELMTTPTKI